MPSTQSSPKILKGAFIAFYPNEPQPRTIVFQLNPEPLKRSIIPPQSKRKSSGFQDVRERISFVLSVDKHMGDDFFVQNTEGISHGVLPFLSAIELLAYPTDAINEESTSSRNRGLFGKVNYVAKFFRRDRSNTLPFVSLVFGEQRIIPIKILSIQIVEQAFDSRLHPIRASVEIVMETLTERESKRHPNIKEIYINYHNLKAMLANGNAQQK